jgi:diguanylate cyclase
VKKSIGLILIVLFAFLCYALAALLQLGIWPDLLALAFDYLAAAMIFHAIFTSKNKQFRPHFILAGAAVLFWAAADTQWFIYTHLLNADPNENAMVNVLYFGTIVCLVAAMVLYAYYRLRKWDTVQLILDGLVFSASLLWLLWVLMYKRSIDRASVLLDYGVMNTLSIGMDVFLIVVIGIWHLSIRKGRLPMFLCILVGGVFAYAAVDLLYFHLYANNLYVPDSFVDICYLASLMSIAVSVKLYYIRYPAMYANENPNTNIGNIHKGLLLLVCPVLIYILGSLSAADITFYAVIILFHEGASSYIQKSISNRERLNREIDANKKLEQLVSEKVNDLKAVNAKLLQRNEDLKYANQHDSLTRLHNRNYFMDKLDAAITAASDKRNVALVLWNIDNLKGINDTYGHYTGDQILITHAERVQKVVGGTGVLARLGGDEFAFALEGALEQEDVMRVAEKVVGTGREPYQIGGYTFNVSVSAGISIYPNCAADRSTLLRNADIAMHYAKETKPDSRIAAYRDIDTAMNRKYQIGNCLRTADYNEDLRLHFQPQFRIADRELVGMEALLRWNCPGIGPVSPAEFIPIAEDENLIIPIGNWVIENAVSQIAKWNRAYRTNLRMGINFSPKQFDQTSTFDVLDEAIKRHHATFKWIDIEITENVALDNEDSAGNIKKYFKTKQLTVSIDDFGTGYSSLGYLTILSFDRLKIAKPLIDKITTDEPSRKIVTSIILLAKSLDLLTIAEGVETKAQYELLEMLGCDQIQGYYLGVPMPADAFETKFLEPKAPDGSGEGSHEQV